MKRGRKEGDGRKEGEGRKEGKGRKAKVKVGEIR